MYMYMYVSKVNYALEAFARWWGVTLELVLANNQDSPLPKASDRCNQQLLTTITNSTPSLHTLTMYSGSLYFSATLTQSCLRAWRSMLGQLSTEVKMDVMMASMYPVRVATEVSSVF